MSFLITGASGFTGSHIMKNALKKGYSVRGLVQTSSRLDRLKGLEGNLIKGDITDKNVLRKALQGIEVVVHTAACVSLGLVDKQEMMRVNVEGTKSLLEVSHEVGVRRFIYCSTIGVFGDTRGYVVDETFSRQQQGFSSCYDQSKFEAQLIVDKFGCDNNLEVISILPSGIMGLGDPHLGPLFTRFLAGKLPFFAGANRITGIVHVADVADLLILAAEKGRPGEKYIASSGELTMRQMFELLSVGKKFSAPLEIPAPAIWLVAALMEVVGRVFSFNPPVSLERAHYLYNRCVRVNADKAKNELSWIPMPPSQIIKSLIP